MKLPLVSRLAFDMVRDERDRLRAQNDDLLDTLKAVKRVEVGLREKPRPTREERRRPMVPLHVSRLYEGRFQNPATESEIKRRCEDMASGGTPWGEIEKVLLAELGEPPEAEA